jgi:signal transduction histidine kinase
MLTLSTVALVVRQNLEQEVKAYVFRGGKIAPSELITQLESYYAAKNTWKGSEGVLSVYSMGGPMMNPGRGRGPVNHTANPLRIANTEGAILVGLSNISSENVIPISDLRSSAYPLRVNDEIVGYLLPQQGMSFPDNFGENALINSLNQSLFTAAMISGTVALVLAIGLAYAVSRPVQQLTQAVSHLSNGDLDQRVEVRGRDELSRLGTAFNQMAESLNVANENRRAMTADIAHELRTPLAIQRAHLEALQDGIYPLTLANLDPVIEQNHMLAHLVDDLRTLALADAGELRMQMRKTNFNEIIQRLAVRFQSKSTALGTSIEISIPSEQIDTEADPERINQILNNLVSNALRYTPPKGKVGIHLEATNKSVVITISDSGPGIPAVHLTHIFERFYRADKSRSRTEGGTGLGLSIARQLAHLHGGSLTAANIPGGGAEFTLTLPKTSSPQRN